MAAHYLARQGSATQLPRVPGKRLESLQVARRPTVILQDADESAKERFKKVWGLARPTLTGG